MEFEHSNPSSYFNAFLDIALYTNIYIHTHTCIYFCDIFSFRFLISDGKTKFLFCCWCKYLRSFPFLCITEVDLVLNLKVHSWLQFNITSKDHLKTLCPNQHKQFYVILDNIFRHNSNRIH